MNKTQAFNDQTQENENKLTEEDLAAVSGGIVGGETVDSHDPNICSTFTETEHRCLGLRTKTPCEHYRSTHALSGSGSITYHRQCLMGYFDYRGSI